ncbi:hypothetical protein P8452_21390 [Trifolium repens]|nr:hypothetical protein P8452_21390 [Trifolium repens]
MIRAFAKTKIWNAISLFKTMLQADIRPDNYITLRIGTGPYLLYCTWIQMFSSMRHAGKKPDGFTLAGLLNFHTYWKLNMDSKKQYSVLIAIVLASIAQMANVVPGCE